MATTVREALEHKVRNITGGGRVTLYCQKDAQGNIHAPTGITVTMRFSIAELRELGIMVKVLTLDGRELTDDEHAAMIVAERKRLEDDHSA